MLRAWNQHSGILVAGRGTLSWSFNKAIGLIKKKISKTIMWVTFLDPEYIFTNTENRLSN